MMTTARRRYPDSLDRMAVTPWTKSVVWVVAFVVVLAVVARDRTESAVDAARAAGASGGAVDGMTPSPPNLFQTIFPLAF